MYHIFKKKSFVANHLLIKIEKLNMKGGKRNNNNLVPGIYHYTHNDRIYNSHSNGKKPVPVYITGRMAGQKLGKFAHTLNFREHTRNNNKSRR